MTISQNIIKKIAVQYLVLTAFVVAVYATWIMISVAISVVWKRLLSSPFNVPLEILVVIYIVIWLVLFIAACRLALNTIRRLGLMHERTKTGVIIRAGVIAALLLYPSLVIHLLVSALLLWNAG